MVKRWMLLAVLAVFVGNFSGQGAWAGQAVVRYSRPPERVWERTFEPFADVVCQAEAERARIRMPNLVTVLGAEQLFPYSCGSTTFEESVIAYRSQTSGEATLVVCTAKARKRPEGNPSLATLGFRVPETGKYYLFLKGDSSCCSAWDLEFRIDEGPVQKAPEHWGIARWHWRPLRSRSVPLLRDRPVSVPLAFDLAGGAHTLDLVWVEAPCTALTLDAFVVSRSMRIDNRDHWSPERTVLDRAVEEGHRELVALLLAQGAPVNVGPRPPVWHAEWRGDAAMVALFRRHGALPAENVSRFYDAVQSGDVPSARALLDESPGLLRVPFEHYGNALHVAAGSGNPFRRGSDERRARMAAILIARGVDINARDRHDGWAPLHWCVRSGSLGVAKVLLAHGADAGARDYGGETPLHVAADDGAKAFVTFLLNAGVDVNVRADYGSSPLHTAAYRDQVETATLLLDRGADCNALGGNKSTALHRAASRGSVPMATLLLERGAKATLADDDRTTPLHEAAWDGQHVLVRLLLDHGAKVNAADRHGRTPLHRAVSAFRPERSEKRDYVRTIEMLVQAGSSTTAVDCNGRTPLEGVQSEYRERIRQLLLP